MAGLRKLAGPTGAKRRITASGLAVTIAATLVVTTIPSALSSAGGGSAALAELLARSPGARIGGVALKAKKRASLAAAPSEPVQASPSKELAALAAGAPEGPLPGFVAPALLPADIFPPAIPALAAVAPSSGPGFAGLPPPAGIGGGGVFIGGGGSGGGGGGSGGISPGPPISTPPTPQPTANVPGTVAPVPEPATWLMLIIGFGALGSAMRLRRQQLAIP